MADKKNPVDYSYVSDIVQMLVLLSIVIVVAFLAVDGITAHGQGNKSEKELAFFKQAYYRVNRVTY